MPSPSTRAGKKPAREPVTVSPARGDTAGSVVDSPTVVTFYGWGGSEVTAQDQSAVAKTSFDPATKVTRYWLKRATTGGERGFLFNPQSPTIAPGALNRVATQLGKGTYEYRPATKAAFDFYIQFATPPHNPTHLRNAERST